jgi:hypothetical protein
VIVASAAARPVWAIAAWGTWAAIAVSARAPLDWVIAV